jgi:hypothetical protein
MYTPELLRVRLQQRRDLSLDQRLDGAPRVSSVIGFVEELSGAVYLNEVVVHAADRQQRRDGGCGRVQGGGAVAQHHHLRARLHRLYRLLADVLQSRLQGPRSSARLEAARDGHLT